MIEIWTSVFLLLAIGTFPHPVQLDTPPSNYHYRLLTPLQLDPPISASIDEVIRYYGYPAEKHTIETEDGYILTAQRIPHNKSINTSVKNEPIIMLPGLLATSFFFLVRNKFHSTAFFFSDAGFDVWLYNPRGSRYCKNHKTLVPYRDRAFWNYSFHEMGVLDLPAVIDYVLSVTGAKQVYLLGHSMGGTTVTIFLADKPAYNEKVKAAFLLAPALKIDHSQLPCVIMKPFLEIAFKMFLKNMDAMPYTELTIKMLGYFCNMNQFSKFACKFAQTVAYYTETFQEPDAFMNELIRFTTGVSTKTVDHFLQMCKTGNLSQYDYGKTKNLEMYGQVNPPTYDLKNITTPVKIYYGDADAIVDERDVQEATHWFSEATATKIAGYSHMYFTMSRDTKEKVYEPILNDIKIFGTDTKILNNLTVIYLLGIIIVCMLIAILIGVAFVMIRRKQSKRTEP